MRKCDSCGKVVVNEQDYMCPHCGAVTRKHCDHQKHLPDDKYNRANDYRTSSAEYKSKTYDYQKAPKTDASQKFDINDLLEVCRCKGYFDFLAYPRYQSLKACMSDIDYLKKIGPCGWNSNPGYGDRCISHLKEVYTILGSDPKPLTWVINNTYTTLQDLNIRKEPDGDLLLPNEITQNAREHSFMSTNGNAVLKRGTKVTVKEICERGNTTWLRIPSGWICGKNSKNIYVS